MRRRSLLALAHAARTGCLVATFCGALAGGVVLHANTPTVRRLTADLGNEALRSLFDGKIVARDVTSLSIGRRTKIHIREAELTSPEGARIVLAQDIDAEIDLAKLLRSITSGRAPNVELESVRIGKADVVLDTDTNGLTLKRAFTRRVPPTPTGAKTTTTSSSPVPPTSSPVFHLRQGWIGSARVHGNLVPPELDGETHDLAARVDLDADVVTVTLVESRVTLRAPRLPDQRVPLEATATGRFVADLTTTPTTLRGNVDLRGAAGEVPISAHAEMDGERVEATVDIARTDIAALSKVWPTVPVTKPIELHAHAHGELPTILLDARARLGESDVTARAELDLREGKGFVLDVDASHVDATAFGTTVGTDLSGKLHAEGGLGGSTGRQGTFHIATAEGTVASERIPGATIEGRFDAQRITAVLRAQEPGIEATGKFDVDLPSKNAAGAPGVSSPVVTFDVQARSNSLKALKRIPFVAAGTASVRARGKIDVETRSIQATTTFAGENITASSFSARQVAASGVLAGPITSPLLTVGFAGTDVALAVPGKTPLVYPTASGHAKIALSNSPQVLDAEINVGQTGSAEPVSASVRGVRIANGVVQTDGLRVTGLGEPLELDARIGGGNWNIRAKSKRIDLRRAAQVTGIKQLDAFPEGTWASVDVDVRQGSSAPDGHIDLSIRNDTTLPGNHAITAEVHANIVRGKLIGNAHVTADGFGQIEMTRAEIDLPQRLDQRSLERATGTAELRGSIDLSKGVAMFAGEHVERMSGIVSFEARIERGDPSSLPTVRATARTEGLEVALSTDPSSPTTLVAGVDLQAHVAWDGQTDDTEVSVLAWDKLGLVAQGGAKAKLPLAAWAMGTKKVDPRALADLTASAFAEVPSRDLAELPPFLHLPPLRGKVEGHVSLDGTLGHPDVIVSGRARTIREDRRRNPGTPSFNPIDGTLEARWDGERASISFALDERERRRRSDNARRGTTATPPPEQRPTKTPGHLHGLVLVTDLRVRDLLRGRPLSELPWVASTELEAENLELRAVPSMPAGVTGTMRGRASIKDLNRNASFEATAHVDDFGAGGARVESFDLVTNGHDASLFARATVLDRRSAEPTQIRAQLTSKSLRIKGVDVSWDHLASTRLDYSVQNGQLALLAPIVKSAISEIEGRVDGAGSVSIEETSQVFDGGLAVQGARLYVNVLGEEITALDATARFERSGAFRIDDARGKMGSGEFRASATGQMKGFQFMGADATLIASKDGIPISSEGAIFAEATGEAKVTAKMSDDRKTLAMTADVPRANVMLPDRSTQALQDLDPDPSIATGIRRLEGEKKGQLDTSVVRRSRGGTGKQSVVANEGLVTRLAVTLGDEVRLTGRGMDVQLKGHALVEIAQELAVSGQIDIRGGSVEVQGRQFTVDRGTVTFPDLGDPSNPTVVAAAYWDSPDRTRVWVELAGPLKDAQMRLHSEPAYSPTEILSVLLFGRADPNVAAAADPSNPGGRSTGDSSGATSVASGFLATGLNQALAQFDRDLDVETDTLSGNRARGKVGRSFFDRRLKVQVGYAPGSGSGSNYQDTTFLFLSWQFVPKWSLLGTAGNTGTSILDVLFQHRY